MFEQAFKNIDDVLWKEAGCTTVLDCPAGTFQGAGVKTVFHAPSKSQTVSGEFAPRLSRPERTPTRRCMTHSEEP
jgi:hypothetical protein